MGKVEGGMKCVKYLLFLFNFIFWIFGQSDCSEHGDTTDKSLFHGFTLMGSLVLAVGLWLRLEKNTVALLGAERAPETFFIGVYILIVAGGLVMLVGFFGCCGAVRESQCLLGLFFACLLIIFAAEIAAGVFGFLNKNQIIEDVKTFYKESAEDTKGNNTVILSSYHTVLNCCGTSTTKTTQCSELPTGTRNCDDAIEEFFNCKLFIIGYIGIGLAGVMVVGMIFSMVLCCAVRNSREVI